MSSQEKVWKRKKATVKKGDTLVVDGRPTDLVIAVMGPTGVGKSTFVNALFGAGTTIVGHELKSCTSNLKHVIRPLPSDPTKRLVVVDTPGFDDTYVDDAEILRRISVWLATSYTSDMKLAGVIYLHEISQTRMLGTTRKNLEMFRKLCGDDAISSVVLGTTKWSEVATEVGEARLQQLGTNFWKDMIEGGSRVFQFENTSASAWSMANYLLNRHDKKNAEYDVLQLQEELVDLQKIIPDTDAGKELRYTLDQLLKMQRNKATEEQLQKTLKAIQALKVPISLRLRLALMSPFRWELPGVVEEAMRSSYGTYTQRSTATTTRNAAGYKYGAPAVVSRDQQESYEVSKRTKTYPSMFKKSHHFSIGGAVLNDGDNTTVQYNHKVTTHYHYHFHKPIDSGAMKLIANSMNNLQLISGDGAGSSNQRVHLHRTT